MSRTRGRVIDSDRAMLDRAARRLGLQAGGLVAAVVVALSVVVGLLIVHEQRGSDEALLHNAAASADDAADPPAGMWLVLVDRGGREVTPGLPRSLPYLPDLRTAQLGGGRPSADSTSTTSMSQSSPGLDLRVLSRPC